MSRLRQISTVQGHAKYKQAKQEIYQHILRTGAKPGDKVCTEAVLMKDLGISVTTARRALEELVREGILDRRVGKGTFFKSLPVETGQASSTVLLLGHQSWQFLREDVFFGRIIGALGERLRQAGLRQVVLINDWGHDPETELEDIRKHNPAAIIYPYGSFDSKPFILSMLSLGVPLMVYGNRLEGLGAAQIYFDEQLGGLLAARHFFERGYQNVATIAPQFSPAGHVRQEAFAKAVAEQPSMRLVGSITAAGYGEDEGYRCVDGLMSKNPRPRAIFCGGDLLAYGAIKRLEELGLSVPNDVAVMGYGDFKVSSFYHPQLTTIRMDLEQMGRQIGRWVEQRACQSSKEEEQRKYDRKLPVELLVRNTT
ncbi:MAG: GntR family transcriptional regulator [Phycisphaerales bacterium]|jgi:DNA-binding LacI/PurR family transcriptional regulator|nr:GntR family transcriptional regulator [Phycisphaerales bacterium]